jgi:hypothetical protein
MSKLKQNYNKKLNKNTKVNLRSKNALNFVMNDVAFEQPGFVF